MPLPPRMLRDVCIGGRYRICDPIGRGGMGAVYEAIDQKTDRLRAIKLVDGCIDDDAKARFRREATIAGRVESPHVVDIVDSGHDPELDVLFLVMEGLRGEDLGAVLARDWRLPKGRALALLEQTSRGLTCLHDEGIVHRDLKPENVFLVDGRGGEAAHATIVDLGLAKNIAGTASTMKTTRAVGTPLFMAPEQF